MGKGDPDSRLCVPEPARNGKTSPDMNQPEPVVQQEPEIACNACGQTGGDNCPDCGAVMGDATYQETFDEESQVEAKENDPEEMEGAEHPHNENAGSDPHRDCSDETGEVADPVIVEDIEPYLLRNFE
ncbi:hypothetical protein ECZC06_56270 [Escherichia coli]|nr:hypothetical protein ECZC06_56270 [Escherichia coli]